MKRCLSAWFILVCLFKSDSFCHLGLIPECALAAASQSVQGENPHGIFLETKELLGEMSDSFRNGSYTGHYRPRCQLSQQVT